MQASPPHLPPNPRELAPEELDVSDERATWILARLGLTWDDLLEGTTLDLGAGASEVGMAAERRGVNMISLDAHPTLSIKGRIASLLQYGGGTPNSQRERKVKDMGLREYVDTLLNEAQRENHPAAQWRGRETELLRQANVPVSKRYIQASAEKIPYWSNSFRRVVCHGAPPLNHVSEPREFKKIIFEALRVLTPDGEFRFGPAPILPDMLDKLDPGGQGDPYERSLKVLRRIDPQTVFQPFAEEDGKIVGGFYVMHHRPFDPQTDIFLAA